jgi:hypothetical protein
VRQLRALVALRWRMIRDVRVRRGLLLLALSLPLLVVAGGAAGQVARDSNLSFNILLLTPSLYLGFAVLTVVAPLSSGGGNELFPREQLVALPVDDRTSYLASLASAPLNLAWATQVVSIAAATSFVANRTPLVLLSELTALAYVAFTTAAGQALGWWVAGLRQGAVGRVVTRALGTVILVGVVALVVAGRGTALLDRSPTTAVTIAAVQGSQKSWWGWASVTGALLLAAGVSFWAGGQAARWALRRPEHRAEVVTKRQVRRQGAGSTAYALLRTDRNSVWRAEPLRRGLLVLALLPGGVTAAVHVHWESLPLLPGLVAAGAGLLFGVNAFCLDGQGGPWLASLPHSARSSALAKARVTAETCLVAVLLSLALATLGTPGTPAPAELSALLSSVITVPLLVTATCTRLSVERPHRADLRGPRDAPAPPATMAVYSLRLALSTTLVGTLFVGAAASGQLLAGPVLAACLVAWSVASLRASISRLSIAAIRARVVMTVAAG